MIIDDIVHPDSRLLIAIYALLLASSLSWKLWSLLACCLLDFTFRVVLSAFFSGVL